MFMKVQDTTDLAASLLVAVRGDERVRFDRDSSFREAVISDNPEMKPRRGLKKDVDPQNRPF